MAPLVRFAVDRVNCHGVHGPEQFDRPRRPLISQVHLGYAAPAETAMLPDRSSTMAIATRASGVPRAVPWRPQERIDLDSKYPPAPKLWGPPDMSNPPLLFDKEGQSIQKCRREAVCRHIVQDDQPGTRQVPGMETGRISRYIDRHSALS